MTLFSGVGSVLIKVRSNIYSQLIPLDSFLPHSNSGFTALISRFNMIFLFQEGVQRWLQIHQVVKIITFAVIDVDCRGSLKGQVLEISDNSMSRMQMKKNSANKRHKSESSRYRVFLETHEDNENCL